MQLQLEEAIDIRSANSAPADVRRCHCMGSQDTRARMLAWLFAAAESNAERAKTMPDYRLAAPDGFFMNLAAVCLKLCQPFINPSAKTWARIEPGCGPSQQSKCCGVMCGLTSTLSGGTSWTGYVVPHTDTLDCTFPVEEDTECPPDKYVGDIPRC